MRQHIFPGRKPLAFVRLFFLPPAGGIPFFPAADGRRLIRPTPVYAFFMVDTVHTIFYSAVALLIVIRHHANIRRLLRGEESKIKLKKSQD